MEVYFGRISPEDLANYGDVSSLFNYKDEYYWYKLVLDLEDLDIRIEDTCNRYIPISTSDMESLSNALMLANMYQNAHKKAQEVFNKELNIISQMEDFFNANQGNISSRNKTLD